MDSPIQGISGALPGKPERKATDSGLQDNDGPEGGKWTCMTGSHLLGGNIRLQQMGV
ncbi:hypothetical protein ACFOEY_17120 [Paracandidimonas soli]|uniref:hypothetical protein n=1 Tax=Paracandidimonas soli TaxID=1917182 RepID=UPI0036095E83